MAIGLARMPRDARRLLLFARCTRFPALIGPRLAWGSLRRDCHLFQHKVPCIEIRRGKTLHSGKPNQPRSTTVQVLCRRDWDCRLTVPCSTFAISREKGSRSSTVKANKGTPRSDHPACIAKHPRAWPEVRVHKLPILLLSLLWLLHPVAHRHARLTRRVAQSRCQRDCARGLSKCIDWSKPLPRVDCQFCSWA